MRIITGMARGTKLDTLPGEETRPTGEKAKEGIFSAIQFDLHDRKVLDLFAGSGQLSLEALSRGAESAVLIDASRAACEIIKQNATRAKLMERTRIACYDYKEYIRGAAGRQKFDLVFLDPPYDSDMAEKAFDALERANMFSDDCIVVIETSADRVPEPKDGWQQKLYRYGIAHVSILRRGN